MDSNSLIMLAGMTLMMIVMMGGLVLGGWTIFRRHRRHQTAHRLTTDLPKPTPSP
jgi:hypothetical protein